MSEVACEDSTPRAWPRAVPVLAIALLGAGAAGAQGCGEALSAGQRSKFQLSLAQACKPAPDAAGALAAKALAKQGAAQTGEAVQLQLFNVQGAVSVRGDATPIATSPTVRRPIAGALPSRPASTLPRSDDRALRLAPEVDDAARKHDIDPLLLHAIAHVESRHRPEARSPAGARGLMQVMPATGQRFGVTNAVLLEEPRTSLEVSATYLKTLQQRFGTDLPLVLAAYNAGEGAVERHGRRIPPYAETRGYVRQVIERYEWLGGVQRRLAATGTERR